MNFPNLSNLPAKTFDAVGADRTRGNNFFFAPKGEKAGFFCEDGEGIYSANIHFSENAQRIFFVRVNNEEKKKIDLSIQLEENSEILFVVEVFEKKAGIMDFSLISELAKNAKITLLFFHFSEGNSRVNIQNFLRGEDSESKIQTAFFGKNSAKNKISVENIANGQKVSGDIKMRAALSGKANCEMRGAPIVEKNAREVKNHLEQKTILMSPEARIRTFPILSVKNNEVEASHKSSLLRLFEDDLFYCASRGIDAKAATKLLQKSFISEMLGKVSDESLCRQISEFAENFFEKNV